MKYLLIILFIPVMAHSQSARFDSITKKPLIGYYDSTHYTIIYPIIKTGNKIVDDNINQYLRNKLFDSFWDGNISDQSANALLDSTIQNGLVYMSYNFTYNNHGLLSLFINIEDDGGAHPNGWIAYFNFDLKTGKSLTIDDVIKTEDTITFKQSVLKDKADSINNYINTDLKDRFERKEIDSDGYKAIIDDVNSDCINSISIATFSLTNLSIEIIDNCEFPHVIQSMEPGYSLIYSYQSIKNILNKNFKNKVL